VHDELVAALGPALGVEWLEVATGTGEVALRAARAGAVVTALDLAPVLLEQAEGKAERAGVPVRFDVGNAERLPYDGEAFEVVSSSFGFIFAAEHHAAAGELARVCRPEGRLGFTAWRPNEELAELYRPYGQPPEGRQAFDWGRPEYVEELLGGAFELDLSERVWFLDGRDGEELWSLWRRAAPPFKAMVESLDEGEREGFHADYVAYCERHRTGEAIRVPRPYLLVLGRRR